MIILVQMSAALGRRIRHAPLRGWPLNECNHLHAFKKATKSANSRTVSC
jgi:hypothetical protein